MLGRLLWKPLTQRGPLHRVTPIKTGGVRAKERKGEKEREEGAKKREKIWRTFVLTDFAPTFLLC